MESNSRILANLADVETEAQRLVEELAPGSKATFITLSGHLGAGKTTFTQAIAKAMGVTDVVNSPTFVIEKIYAISGGKFERLVHVDAYRLKGAADLAVLGFDEVLEHSGTLVVLEWPERVEEIATRATMKVTLEALEDGARRITYA